MSHIPDTKTGKVICDCMILRCSIIADFIFGLGHVHRWGNVVGESTVLIKVDDQQTMRVNNSVHNGSEAVLTRCPSTLSDVMHRISA
jgi:hypothetical protein